MKRLLFFVNPKAGTHAGPLEPARIQRRLGPGFSLDWIIWERALDGTALIRQALDRSALDGVVAMGGDGTVNQVAAALVHTAVPLAIVPRGSGNGLARHLKIPLNLDRALDLLRTGRETIIDTAQIGTRPFVCTAGVGFDAYIGHLFAGAPRRGLSTYARLGLRELLRYQPRTYDLTIDGRPLTARATLITFGNAAQWGNDAQIAPLADIRDGLLHVTLIRRLHPVSLPMILVRLFNGSLHRSPAVQTFCGRAISVHSRQPGHFHYDGEPEALPRRLTVRIHPRSLKVIAPAEGRG